MVVNLERDRVRGTEEPQVLSSPQYAGVQTLTPSSLRAMVQGSGVQPSPTHRPESTTRGDIVGVIVDVKQVDLLDRDLAGGQLPLLRVHLRDRRRSGHSCSKDRLAGPRPLGSTLPHATLALSHFLPWLPIFPRSGLITAGPLPSLTTPLRSSP